MDQKNAENEMRYRLVKIVLTVMLEEGIISESEFEAIRKKLIKKLKPLIGSLD
ncbi:hypothetical protein JCM15765_40020 [Paradesulfitobacterium aromaticivorans]